MSRYALICRIVLVVMLAAGTIVAEPKPEAQPPEWLRWHRPVDNPVFTVDHGNNHDSILFVEPDLEYPYHLIISHEREHAELRRRLPDAEEKSDPRDRRVLFRESPRSRKT